MALRELGAIPIDHRGEDVPARVRSSLRTASPPSSRRRRRHRRFVADVVTPSLSERADEFTASLFVLRVSQVLGVSPR
jgi:hypothetical protein